MAFLSDSRTFHELTDDIFAACQPFSYGLSLLLGKGARIVFLPR